MSSFSIWIDHEARAALQKRTATAALWEALDHLPKPADSVMVCLVGSKTHDFLVRENRDPLEGVEFSDAASKFVVLFSSCHTTTPEPSPGWRQPLTLKLAQHATGQFMQLNEALVQFDRPPVEQPRSPAYVPGRAAEGMERLSRRFGKYFEGIDPEEYVRELRAD